MRARSVSALGLAVLTAIALSAPASGGERGARAETKAVRSTMRTVALGVSMWSGRDLAQLDDFTASIAGRKPASWTIWSPWGDPEMGVFPTAAATGARARGAVPMIWWEPYTPSDPTDTTYSRLKNIADGKHDAYIRRYARDAKAFKGRILLRLIPQANSDHFPWAWDYSATDDNTISTFRSAWRRVVKIFRNVGASNVKFVWSIATQRCAGDCLSRPLGYPGDSYVDYLGFTWENWGDAQPSSVIPSKPWTPMVDGFRPIVKSLSSVSNKRIMAAAMASGPHGGDKAAWIRNGYPAVYRELPKIVAIMWLNMNLSGAPHYHRDWSLSGASLQAYADIAAMPEFRGTIP
jgi:hypothetical protein